MSDRAPDVSVDSPVHSRVVVCSPIRLYREGLARVLGTIAGVDVVAAVGSREECTESARRVEPDMVLLDTTTDGCVDTVRELSGTPTQVIALAVPEVEAEVIAFAEAGVNAYVTRDQSLEDLLSTLQAVGRGEVVCSPRTAGILLRRVRAVAENGRAYAAEHVHLTARELDILLLLEEGLSNKEICQRLCIELPTVKNHVHHILEKLAVSRRAEAVAWLHAHRPLAAHLNGR